MSNGIDGGERPERDPDLPWPSPDPVQPGPPPLPAWMAELDLAIFDLETTGLEIGKDRITQIAVIHVNRGDVVSEWQTLVNPGIPIPREVTEITGTTDAMVKHAPTFQEVRTEVLWRLGMRATGRRRVVAGYNTRRFDAPTLEAELLRTSDGVKLEGAARPTDAPSLRNTIDVFLPVWVVDRWERGSGRLQLANVAKRHGLEVTRAHEALADCWLTWGILRRFAHHFAKWRVNSLADFWPWQERTADANEADHQRFKAKMAARDAGREDGGGYSRTGEDPAEQIARGVDDFARDPAEGDR